MVVSLTTCVLGLTMLATPADAPASAHQELKAALAEPDEAKALAQLESLRAKYPAWALPRVEVAELLLRRGDSLDRVEWYLEGARCYLPENPRVHYLWGLLQVERGKLDAAEKAFSIALLFRDDYDEARLRLASVEMSLSKFDQAAEAYRALAARQPEATAVKLGLASALEKGGKKLEAEQVLKALLAGPAKVVAARRLAEIYRGQGRVKEADQVMKGIDTTTTRKLRPLKPSRK